MDREAVATVGTYFMYARIVDKLSDIHEVSPYTTLRSGTVMHKLAGDGLSTDARIESDAYPSHGKLAEVASEVNAKVVKPKDAPKSPPWVHTAIANAKSLFRDMYHGIKEEFLQEYLNEFCYKFNRRYFGDRVFDRLVIAAISDKPTFEHRMYGSSSRKCG